METQTPIQGAAAGNGKPKTPKVRSVAYPAHLLPSSIEHTRKIDEEFTDVVYTPREEISKAVGVAGGGFDRLISACVQYGLVEIKQKEGYKPTALFKKIKRPLPEENVDDFYKECLSAPPLYRKLIEHFSGKQLPSLTGLANLLDRNFQVKGDAATTAARVFLKNLETFGLIGEGNTLQLEAGITTVEDLTPEDGAEGDAFQHTPIDNPQLRLLPPVQQLPPPTENPNKTIPVFLKGGREATLSLPPDFSEEDLAKVVKVLNAYL